MKIIYFEMTSLTIILMVVYNITLQSCNATHTSLGNVQWYILLKTVLINYN